MNEFLLNQNGILIPSGKDYSAEIDKEENSILLRVPNGSLSYLPQFISPGEADEYLGYFMEQTEKGIDSDTENPEICGWKNVPWRQDPIKMFGKMVLQPRLTAWYADEGKNYQYSGLQMIVNPWNERMLKLKSKVEAAANSSFNSVLLNAYRNGQDYMGWHADDEPELGTNPLIASVNFGASRRFLLRRNSNQEEKIEILLRHGSLLLMQGPLQHFWKHSIPKQLKINQLRVNLTFRKIV